MAKFIDLTNQKFGRLTVVSRTPKRPRAWWLCLCECGKETVASGENLARGSTKSCGCLAVEWGTKLGEKRRKHVDGWQPTEGYLLWRSMISRCYCKGNSAYKWYGAKGVKVCERWLGRNKGFKNFAADMWPRPDNTTLDRKDNDGDYSPDNCKWSTRREQSRNRTDTNNLTINGRTMCAKDWAAHAGISYTTFLGRLKRGWHLDDIISRPIDRRCWKKAGIADSPPVLNKDGT